MNIVTTSNAAEFAQTFAQYRKLSRKVPGDALAHRAGRMSMRLYEEFAKLRPNIGAMISQARTRNYRLKRAGNNLTKTQEGLSAVAVERARAQLGGRKSEWFRVYDGPDGVPDVRPARVGTRRSNRLLIGGRSGRKFAKTALPLSKVEDPRRSKIIAESPDVKRLNLRALSVAIELQLRARSGRGGLLALQFLHSVYRTRKNQFVKSGPLIARTRGGVSIGSVVFENSGPNGDVSGVTIKGDVPGTSKVNRNHGVADRAVSAETKDMRVYIEQKLAKARKDAGLK